MLIIRPGKPKIPSDLPTWAAIVITVLYGLAVLALLGVAIYNFGSAQKWWF